MDSSRLKRSVLFVCFCALFFSILFSRVTIENIKTSTPPEIDGVLDDPVWKKAKGYSDFKSIVPEVGNPPREKTIVYSAYDAYNLYFAFKCYDKEPGKIVATLRKRDTLEGEDKVVVLIDSHNDGQNAYLFMVNPLGIQMDGVMNSEINSDQLQDFVWYSAGVKDADGYTVEVKIPFKTLRFSQKKVVKMKVGFIRKVVRHAEQYVFPEWITGEGAYLSQLGFFQVEGINYKRIFEVLPVATYLKQRKRGDNEQLAASDEKSLGLTTKIGVTSDLTLDMTVNPDFSHIEIDEGQVNVNVRGKLSFEEKRPFFLEGLEHFNFAGSGYGTPIETIVYTRNIVDPILGLKLSGKIGKSHIVNSLFAIDEYTEPSIDSTTGDNGSESENKYYGILRFKHLIKNDSYMGAIYTGKQFKNGFNHMMGVDSKIRLSGFMTLDAFYLYSYNKNSDTGDRTADETRGSAFGLKFSYDSKKYHANLGYHDLAKNFDLDPGRVWRDRAGIRIFSAYVERYFYIHSGFLKRVTLGYSGRLTRDKNFDMDEYSHTLNITLNFPSDTYLNLGYSLATEVVDGIVDGFLFNENGFFINASSQVTKHLKVGFNYSNSNWPHYGFLVQGSLKTLFFSIDFRPNEKLSTEFKVTRHIFHEDETNTHDYDIGIYRNKTTFQVNKYLSLRGIVEYNSQLKGLLWDSLVEFTYIPGTVIHLGYGSNFAKEHYVNDRLFMYDNFRELSSTFFFKASYLFRF